MKHVFRQKRSVFFSFIAVALFLIPASVFGGDGDTTIVSVFTQNGIHWGNEAQFENDSITAYFGGRIIEHVLTLPEFSNPVRIEAQLEIIPDDGGVACAGDPWDKAGNITLHRPFETPVELVKFITGYGGHTFHVEDVSFLSSLLTGEATIQAHIDTWLSPGWKVTFKLRYIEDSNYENPAWVTPVYYNQGLMRPDVSPTDPAIHLDVPAGLDSFEIAYFTSGHSHVGSGGDEFITKANVIYVNEVEVFRLSPWRSDCTNFGSVNPCGTYWFSRSGWCPGDEVHPYRVDISAELNAGQQAIRHSIENIEPSQGFWRVSSYLAGWSDGSTITPEAIGLEALQGTELSVDEETPLRIRLRDVNGHWIHNGSGTVRLNSDNMDIMFRDENNNWAATQDIDVLSGEIQAYMRGEAAAENAKVWATDVLGGMQTSDTLYFNITQTFADTVGYYLTFDGTDDYVDMGNDPSLRITGNQITIEAKVYADEFKSAVWGGSVVVKDQGGSPGIDRGYMLRCGGNGEVNINLGDGSWHELTSPTGSVPLQVWTHLAGTYDGDKLRLYVNGNLVAESNSLSVNIGNTDMENLLIGESPGFPGRVFDGHIDEVRLWDVARSQTQIQQTMIGKLDSTYYATADSGLVGYWNFDDGSGQFAADLGVNANNGQLGSTLGEDPSDPVWVNANPNVGIEDEEGTVIGRFSLSQNYPNPFNPSTTIVYEIPVSAKVTVKVYDVLGREIDVLVNDLKNAGKHQVIFDAGKFASGIYYYKMSTKDVVITKKMMLLK